MSSNAYNANFLFHGVYADTRVYLIGKTIGLLFSSIPRRTSEFHEVRQTKSRGETAPQSYKLFLISGRFAFFFIDDFVRE